jgi:GT2 family glycosyltransferase
MMSDDALKPKPDPGKSARAKSASKRSEQVEAAKARLSGERRAGSQNRLVDDETYGDLREDNRVVMRHQIALNLESFRAAPVDFVARPTATFPELRVVTSPFLSVIIPNYNGQRFLPTLMNALRGQSFGDFEVIVVDDASSDDSVAWLEAHWPEARVVVNRSNQGFVAACNMGADVARGRVIAFLNNDTEPDAGWTAALARAVCEYPESGIFAAKLLLFDRRDTLHSAGDTLGLDGVPRNRGVWERDMGQYDRQTAVFGGCGGAVAYRRDLWQTLKGFDDALWMYLEDVDFAFRAQLLGWGAVFVPEARVYHHLSATGGGALASYYVGRNTIWVIAKNMPRGLLLRHAPRIVAGQARIALDALRNWRGAEARARLRGMVAGLLGLPAALAKRKLIQPRRVIEDRDLLAKLAE